MGHFSLHLYRFEAQSIEGFVKVKTMSESLVSKTCTDSFFIIISKTEDYSRFLMAAMQREFTIPEMLQDDS